jgi:integrase
MSVKIRGMIMPHVPANTPADELTAIGCHTLRRSGALALYNKWIKEGRANAMELVQALLGHDKISTTQVYLSLNFQRAARNEAMAGMDLFDDEQEGSVTPLRSVQQS